ncbi:MAG: hypothetical protein J0H09_30135 [Burkholderiales bacterium]|nr:hypothetical protein [Burkholderiales bacterium]
MSSLSISLWLLIALAIVVVIGFNLRQAWPRWRRRRASASGGGIDPLAGVSAAGAGVAAGGEAGQGRRNEPRLGGDGQGLAAGDTDFADLPELDEIDRFDGASADVGFGATEVDESLTDDPGRRVGSAPHAASGAHADRVPPSVAGAAAAQTGELPPWETAGDAAAAAPGARVRPGETRAAPGVRGHSGVNAADQSSVAGRADAGADGSRMHADGAAATTAAAGTASIERAMAAGSPTAASPAAGSPAAGSPAAGSPAAASTTGAAPKAASARAAAPLLSELCDCVVALRLPTSWAGERLLPVTQRFRRAGGKPVAAEARAVGAAADDWQPIAPGQHYEAVRIGILLANRNGPLNALEYSDFIAGVQALAEHFGSSADVPDMNGVLVRARDLDSTCAQFDGIVGLNVECIEPLGPDQLAALAGPLTLVERGNNRYARLGPHGEVVFSVALADVPNRIAFLLDVPRAAPALEPWGQTVGCAMQCAQRLGGRLIDDAGRGLNEADLTRVDRQVRQRYESLEAIGLPAGSSLALKVFN